MIASLVASLLLVASISPLQSFPDRGEPIADEAYIEDLIEAEFENGALPAELLQRIESSEGCFLEEEAAESWRRLEIHAANAGIDVIARWCYRNLATQKRTYRRNCPRVTVIVDPLPPVEGEDPPAEGEDPPVEGEEPPAAEADEISPPAPVTMKGPRICSPPTAKPGNSNHGWGRAADLKSQGQLLTCESEAFLWLQENAHLYGWVHPTWAACGEPKAEAWHWEWGGTQEVAPQVTRMRGFAA
ncbi:MAG: hypothetical protein GY720_18895 [bacterium]|nr:hypothetical protein [bacterium]